MNFTHFAPASENLFVKVIPELSHNLLRRNAALQLAHGQPTFDIIIPIYFGNSKAIQSVAMRSYPNTVKNKEVATTVNEIFKETFTKVSPRPSSKLTTIAADV